MMTDALIKVTFIQVAFIRCSISTVFYCQTYKCFDLKVDFCISEKYTRGVSAVESILTLDRLRQNVAVKELLQAQGQPLIRKTASVPNFSQVRFEILPAELLFPSGM